MKRFILIGLFVCALCHVQAQINTDRVLAIGRNALYFEDYVLSIQYFNRVIHVKPYLAEPYYFRAAAKYSLEDWRGAEEDCEKALEINPFMVNAYNLKGIIAQRREKFESAFEAYTKGLEVEPDHLNLLMNRGIAGIQLKRFEQAVADYNKVIKLDPRMAGAYLNRGAAHVQHGDTASAMADFSKVVEINPHLPDGYAYRGLLSYQLKQYVNAFSDYNKVIDLKPNESDYYLNRAIIRYHLDDLRGTFADLDKVIELDPQNRLAYSNRGILRAQVGDLNRAADDFTRTLGFDPNDHLTLYNRAMLYFQIGELHKSLADFNRVIAAFPDFGPAYAYRAQIKNKLNDQDGARLDYQTAYKLDQDRQAKGLKAEVKRDDQQSDSDEKQSKETRKSSDRDIRKANQVAVLDDFDQDSEALKTDKETIRGQIQNRDIIIDLEPMFGLSFYTADTLLPRAGYYKPSVEAFNRKKVYPQKLRLTNREMVSETDQAVYYFNRIRSVTEEIKQDPGEMELYFVRGTLYSLVVNYNLAIYDLDGCIQKNPADLNALFNRAYVRFKMVEVIRGMEQANPSKPVELNLNVLKSNAIASTKIEAANQNRLDYELIRADLERILQLSPDFEFAHYNLGILYCIQRDFLLAEQSFSKAIELNGDFSEAYFNRGLVRIYLQQDAAGTADLSKAGELGIFKAYNVIKRYGATRNSTADQLRR